MKEKVIELAKEGISTSQIAEMLDMSEPWVGRIISSLQKEDMELYESIYFKRNYKQRECIDKDNLEKIVNSIFEHSLLCEIAYENHMTIKEIKHLLQMSFANRVSPYFNPDFYQSILNQIEENNHQSKRILYLKISNLEKLGVNLKEFSTYDIAVHNFLKERKYRNILNDYMNSTQKNSIMELTKKYNISTRDLLNLINGEYKNVVSKPKMNAVKEKYLSEKKELMERRKHFVYQYRNPSDKDKELTRDIRTHEKFYLKFMLTFKLNLEELAKVIGFEDISILNQELKKILEYKLLSYSNAISFLNDSHPAYERKEIVELAKKYYQTLKEEDKVPNFKTYIAKKIWDYDYLSLLNKSRNQTKIEWNEQNIRTICLYRLKYALPLARFPFHKYVTENCPEDLKDIMQELNDYNKHCSYEMYAKRKKESLQTEYKIRKLSLSLKEK